MKRLLLSLFAALLTLGLAAQRHGTVDARFVGIWQQQQMVKNDKGEPRLIRLPVWKVYSVDGVFTTFIIANRTAQSVITMQGRFAILNDSICEEHVGGSITAPDLVGVRNPIVYHFDGPDHMKVSYTLPGRDGSASEQWVRVKMEMPRRGR